MRKVNKKKAPFALDAEGKELEPGDIVTVTVKYRVEEITSDGTVLCSKLYDVPSRALTFYGKPRD